MHDFESDRGPAPSPWVARFLPAKAGVGARALDLAAGGGRHSRLLRERSYRVAAVDSDVSRLADLADDPEIEVVAADLQGAPWPFAGQTFDAVVVVNYLHRPLLAHLPTCLAPGGLLIYETFAAGNERFGRPKRPEFLLRPGELLAAFADLHVVAYEHVEEPPPRPAVRQRIVCMNNAELAAIPPLR